MGVYIKNWSLADWKDLLKWAKIGANNAMIGEFSEVEEILPHGRLIDAEWVNKALIETLEALKKNPKMDKEEMHLISAFHTLGVMVADAPTIIESEEEDG